MNLRGFKEDSSVLSGTVTADSTSAIWAFFSSLASLAHPVRWRLLPAGSSISDVDGVAISPTVTKASRLEDFRRNDSTVYLEGK